MAPAVPFRDWIGRTESREDVIAPAPLRGLAALFDSEPDRWLRGAAPPLAHWLYFLPSAKQSELGEDGHPRRGGFLPPSPLPRRMWAGGRLSFHAPLTLGAAVRRTSTIKSIEAKSGAAGDMLFVTVAHEISAGGELLIEEAQDIVYRGAEQRAVAPKPPPQRQAQSEQSFAPDPVLLFRFSALTFNAHRIHYDHDYATQVEGYSGLVVQGPLIAMALLFQHLASVGAHRVAEFEFRAQRPLFAGQEARLCSADGELWCRRGADELIMGARVRTA